MSSIINFYGVFRILYLDVLLFTLESYVKRPSSKALTFDRTQINIFNAYPLITSISEIFSDSRLTH